MQDRTCVNYHTYGLVVGIITCCLATASNAETCKTNIDIVDPATKQVCASWDGGGNPELGEHFTVDYLCTGCCDAPHVTFSAADLGWVLYSEVISSGAAANIGDIDLDYTGGDDFELKIANGTGAGAANVGVINLDNASFSGYSSLEDAYISGNLEGLTLAVDGVPTGGVLHHLTVLGDLLGPMTVPFVEGKGLDQTAISGDVVGAADITIGKMNVGDFAVGKLVCFGGSCPDITVTDKIYRGILKVSFDVPSGSTVKVEELLQNGGVGITEVEMSNAGTFAGTLDLPNGPANADTLIDMGGTLSGTIDLHGGGVGANAEMALYIGTSTAVVTDGGAVAGDVILSQNIPFKTYTYYGTATFASISSTGEISTTSIDPDVDADFGGTLTVTGDVSSGGLIEIIGSLHVDAEINIGTGLSGGLMAGHIDIEKDCTGDITIHNDLSGDIDIGNDQSGDVCIAGDVTSTGDVILVGALANASLVAGGRILVGGENAGNIKVGEKTGSLTLIQVVEGLGSGSTIQINTTEGRFDAEGDIHIGGTTPVAIPFDGCIRIHDDSGSSEDGDLTGDIDVVGCHASGDELIICVDGEDNGNITLDQSGCNPADAIVVCDELSNCP